MFNNISLTLTSAFLIVGCSSSPTSLIKTIPIADERVSKIKFLENPSKYSTTEVLRDSQVDSKPSIKVYNKEYIFENYKDRTKLIQPFSFDATTQNCVKGKNRNSKISNSKIKTDNKVKYLIVNQSYQYSGITSFYSYENKIEISLIQFQGYDAFESLSNKLVENIIHEPSPVTAAITHATTLGLIFLFAPKESYDHAFGCVDNIVTAREIDRSRSEIKLMETVWKKDTFKHSFRILSPDFEFNSDLFEDKELIEQHGNKVIIDLTSKIKSNFNLNSVKLDVFCTTCNLLSPLHQSVLGTAQKELKVTSNLKYTKSELEIAEEKILEKNINEFNVKLATKEGSVCASKTQSTSSNEIFEKCFKDKLEYSASLKKYNDAVSTKEGINCSKKFKIDNSKFWNCYEKNVAETNNKNQQIIDKENEAQRKKIEFANFLKSDDIARQCIEIGFEISTPPYRDCYLKLKLHTEQILEWQKLQASLQSQINEMSQNQSNRLKSESAVDSSVNYDQAEALLGIAQRSFDMASGRNRSASPTIPLMPLPMPRPQRIITPQGNSYNCSMMGAAMRCR